MELIYKFAILRAVPDPRRGEQINVGIIIFREGELDIRFAALSKMAAIAHGNWTHYAMSFADRMQSMFGPGVEPADCVRGISALESYIQLSDVSLFSASNGEQYEERIREIVGALVRRVRAPREQKLRSTRINTEISWILKKAKLLAAPGEGLDTHKVVRDYYIKESERLKADFVYKNGAMHVAATLDLRRKDVEIGEAALKAMVLLKAKQDFDGEGRRYAIYAAMPGVEQFKPHIELMGDFADDAFNWLVKDQRERFTRLMFSALDRPTGLLPN